MTLPGRDVYELLTGLLESKTGQILKSSRHWRVEMALKPVLREHTIPDLSVLASLIETDLGGQLAQDCIEALINNETCFFRDQANFALLTGPVTDSLREKRRASKRLRIWSAACSSGQEPYSVAMAFAENAEKWRGWNIEIVATDVSHSVLGKAKSGRFSQFEIQRGLPVTMMLKYFRQGGEDWIVDKEIRRMLSFVPHNLIESPACLGKFDIILCRNMLMYLSDERKALVLENLCDSLAEGGYLMLGSAETVIGHSDGFHPSDEFRGFYELADSKSNASSLHRMAG